MAAKNGELNAWMRSSLGTAGVQVLMALMTILLSTQGRMSSKDEKTIESRRVAEQGLLARFGNEPDHKAKIGEVLDLTFGPPTVLDRFDLSTVTNGESFVVASLRRLLKVGGQKLTDAKWETENGRPVGGLPPAVQELVDDEDWSAIDGSFITDPNLQNACAAFMAALEPSAPVVEVDDEDDGPTESAVTEDDKPKKPKSKKSNV